MTGWDCSGSGSTSAGLTAPMTWRHPQGSIVAVVGADPFTLTLRDASGNVLVESSPAHGAADKGDPLRAYAPLAMTHNEDTSVPSPSKGWDAYRGDDDPWRRATHVTSFDASGDALVVHVDADDGSGATLRLEPQGAGLHIALTLDDASGKTNRVSLGFRMHDDDHFLGFGERFSRSDHRGQLLYNWVEDAGFGHGEDTPPGPANPSPNGEGMTYIPIPWFMSPRGFGLLLNGTFRTVHHLGDQTPDAWRVESWRSVLDATIFVDPDPLKLIEELTAITGRPPAIADYVLAPRRRADPGTNEVDKLRAAHVATSVIDLDVH